MSKQNEKPMTLNKFEEGTDSPALPVNVPGVGVTQPAAELEWLMSLALDDALETDEAARFEWLLQQAPEYEARWEEWQLVDSDFRQMPSVLPPSDFAEKFAARLEIQERQRRLRTGFLFGLAAVMLWGSALVGLVMLGALVWSNDGAWFASMMQNVTYWWAAVGQVGRAFVNTITSLWEAPQARLVLACYIVAAFAILGGWLALLRRSTRELPMGEAQLVEA